MHKLAEFLTIRHNQLCRARGSQLQLTTREDSGVTNT